MWHPSGKGLNVCMLKGVDVGEGVLKSMMLVCMCLSEFAVLYMVMRPANGRRMTTLAVFQMNDAFVA
jgi:hypothetical protein